MLVYRAELKEYIRTHFGTAPDHPWVKYPDFEVFRHGENQKWFALIMNVPQERLGLPGNESLDVVNFKCDPVLLGSFLGEKGFFPAYHMSKANWITAALDGSAGDEDIIMLLHMSFDATAPKRRREKSARKKA